MITIKDVVLALSNSGETDELLTILPVIKRLDVPLIALTGKAGSTLARYATVTLDVSVPAEACPLNLAPTASTTATLAMGDALAVAVLEARGFTEEDFARSHPGGSLGRRLLLHVDEVMRTGDDLPAVGPDTPLSAGLLEMSRKGLGMTTVLDDARRVLGVFTDGDLRRALESAGARFRTDSDTEVVLRVLERHGAEGLKRLEGMFCLALWNTQTRELTLARDWLGSFDTSLYAIAGLGFPWVTGIGIAGFGMLLCLGGLQAIPAELFDAAAVRPLQLYRPPDR